MDLVHFCVKYSTKNTQLFQRVLQPYLEADDYHNLKSTCKEIKDTLKPCTYAIFHNQTMKIRLNIDFGQIEANQRLCQPESYLNFLFFESQVKSGVKKIELNSGAFAALKTNGSVVTFGKQEHGAFPMTDMSEWEQKDIDAHVFLQKDIVQVVSTSRAFAALNKEGKVMSWGDPQYGAIAGCIPPHPVTPFLEQIEKLYGSTIYFFALKNNSRTIVRWTQNNHVLQNDVEKIEQDSQAGKAKRVKIHHKNGRVEVCF